MPPTQFLAAIQVGNYISVWKCAVLLIVLLLWSRLITWADKDAAAAHLPRVSLNLAMLVGLVVGLGLFFMLPGLAIALAGMCAVLAVEATVYLAMRNQKVGLSDLTTQFNRWIKGLGGRRGKRGAAADGDVVLQSKGGEPLVAPADDAPERGGFDAIQQLLTDPLRKGAQEIHLVPGESSAAVKYRIDGVIYDGKSIDRADAASAVSLLKDAMGLDTSDRRKPQMGAMKATVDGKRQELRILTAGSTAGESLAIDVDIKSRWELSLDQLGFSEDQIETLEESIGDGTGVVLLATPKTQGLTTLEYAILRRHDAFLTHIHTIERAPEIELEGITQNPLASGASVSEEAKLAAWVASNEPDVIMMSRIDDPRSAAEMIKYATKKRAYIGLRAGSTFDALTAWRKLVGDDKLALKNLRMIVCGRVARRLCDACKVDFTPDPELLRRFNMSSDRLGKLYRERTEPLRDHRGNPMGCTFCNDLKFKGRVGFYEIFLVDDEVRKVVLEQGGSVNQLKMLFKKQRQKYLNETAVARVVAGDTSLQEVARVMKIGTEPASSVGEPPSIKPPTRVGPPPTGTKKPPTQSSPKRSP
ncbi:MAG: GspE/PulE family protein [Tepidisphaeraceae bacterium]